MTENTGPMDATGRPMLRFEGMEQSPETPADVEVSDRSMAEKMFPSMEKKPDKTPLEVYSDPFEQRRERLAKAEAEAAEQAAESTELAQYDPGNVEQDYFAIDVDALDMDTLDRWTVYNIDALRAGDGQAVLDRIMPDLVAGGVDEATERAYFQPLLDRVATGEDPKVLTDFATRLLLRFMDAKEKKRKEGLL